MHFVPEIDSFAYRNWGAFDSSAVVNRITDTLFVGGIMIALDKETGQEVWRWKMANYAWSSGVKIK